MLIIDDHALVSTTLEIALRSRGVVAHRCDPGTAEAVEQAVDGVDPGIALVDVDLGEAPDGTTLSGVDLVPLLVDRGWQVLILTGGARELQIAAAVTAGAVGWLHKLTPFEDLLTAVLSAVAGEPVLPEMERLRLVRLYYGEQTRQQARRAGLDQLTARERQVLEGLAAGKRAATIAEESVVSLATVRAQIRAILAKLGVSSQLEAVALLREIEQL
ncbi:LuxR C-terminal-related transcriptional regulator [Pseudonocardia sp. H11422]|uniref:LuxR C-terminal-related transcriptional regulator n=1 Tax=Pseudonocardia sp. H11422 TaxID=2835866 RepID=UPI001BDCBF46|nr:response regulator transcription factor [Pseudonocardia sp. H11422]